MSWLELREILAAEAPDKAAALETAIRSRLGGIRITVPGPQRAGPLSDTEIRSALARHGWCVPDTARELGVASTTIYRRLGANKRQKTFRVPTDPVMDRFIR